MLVTLNAAYKGGEEQTRPPLAVRWAGAGAAGVLLAFALIAAYAIYLRVGQYGWTQQRVMASALNAILLGYGAGYSWAALRSKRWMQKIEGVNIGASFGVLALAAALYTPVADPARGRYGAEALAKLEKSDRPDVRARAVRAASLSLRGKTDPDGVATAATEAPLSHAVIYPKGALLPSGFPGAGRMKPGLDRDCLTDGSPCEIFLLKGPLANEQVILVYTPPGGKDQIDYATSLWTRDSEAKWIPGPDGVVGGCPAALAALRAGRYVIEPSPQQDLVVAGLRVPLGASRQSACPQPAADPGGKKPGQN